jgi:hypothetical protein
MKCLNLALGALLAASSWGAQALGNLADLGIYDRSEGRNLPIYWHQGRAYVVGKPGNEYQLQLRSRQGEEVLAVLSVDGVNVITGETATPQQSGYVLAPGRPLEVKGWRKDLVRTAAFYFTSLSDSYAARTGRPDNVGVIGVALYRRKRPEPELDIGAMSRQAPAAAESRASGQDARREERLGTGHGRTENAPARRVAFERATQDPAETVVIYYDSYQNLLARGIVPRTAAPRPVTPNPFPGFVPDPPA